MTTAQKPASKTYFIYEVANQTKNTIAFYATNNDTDEIVVIDFNKEAIEAYFEEFRPAALDWVFSEDNDFTETLVDAAQWAINRNPNEWEVFAIEAKPNY